MSSNKEHCYVSFKLVSIDLVSDFVTVVHVEENCSAYITLTLLYLTREKPYVISINMLVSRNE